MLCSKGAFNVAQASSGRWEEGLRGNASTSYLQALVLPSVCPTPVSRVHVFPAAVRRNWLSLFAFSVMGRGWGHMESPCSFNGQHWGSLRTVKTQLSIFHVDTSFTSSSLEPSLWKQKTQGRNGPHSKSLCNSRLSVSHCLLHSGRSQDSYLAGLNLRHLYVNLLTKSLQ